MSAPERDASAAKPRVFVTRRLPDRVMSAIASRFELTRQPTEDTPDHATLLTGVHDADGLLATLSEQIDRTVLEAAPRLKVIANCAVGYNNIALEEARARGIAVTNTPDILTETTADLTWALMLAVARRLPEGHQLVQDRRWTGWAPTQLLGVEVFGKTLGVIGMGRIGQAVARRAAGFRMPVVYHTRTPNAGLPTDWRELPLEELLPSSDFVSLHVPLTPDTQYLIGKRELERMKPSAYLINTARGPVVKEAALVEALRAGWLRGAGLDVYEDEPVLDQGLYGCPNVVTLPHLGSATLTTRVAMGLACLENLTATLIEKREPPNRVA